MNADQDALEWKPGRFVPLREFSFSSDTSGGPGGQHANRSATRITLTWDVEATSAFTWQEKQRLKTRLASRMSNDGVVQIRSSSERSARRNRDECLRILATTIRNALQVQKRRIRTRPTAGSKKRRVADKKNRAAIKRGRRKPGSDD